MSSPLQDSEFMGPLLDRLGRAHTSLRVSVTDRCNIRCRYCMPVENVVFRPRDELLTFEELTRFVRVAVSLGVRRVRLTGGEPLLRSELPRLIEQLSAITGVEDLALTTNGMLLAEQASDLHDAGLHRLNVSLDALSEEAFEKISRRRGLKRILDGLFAARQAGFHRIRLNAVALRNLTEDEIVPLARFARTHEFELRFIEFMPLDGDNQWAMQQVLTAEQIRDTLQAEFGPLIACPRLDPSQPAVDYQFADGRGRIGFIAPVSQPFCQSCSRLRITAEGQVRNCLFSTVEWDARRLMRSGGSDQQLRELICDCVRAKLAAHAVGEPDFEKPHRAMYQIGG